MPLVEVVGWAGSALLVLSILQTRVVRLRVLNGIASLILLGYNLAIEVWPMVAMNAVLAAINAWALIGLVRRRHDARAYEAVPMATDEPFLRHLLARHASDVARFNPDLPADPLSVTDHAFVVSAGDEVVGLVLSRDGAAAGEQQVVLDYVLPAYRDFTPGEFVFRPDGPFARLGTRRVVASPGMTASEGYLRAVGFRADGGRQVLDLVAR